MKIAIVTDAWRPQVNGVVRTYENTATQLQQLGHALCLVNPEGYRTMPCPTYSSIRLAVAPGGRLDGQLREFDPDAVHIATEGPLGHAARACHRFLQDHIRVDPLSFDRMRITYHRTFDDVVMFVDGVLNFCSTNAVT